MKSKTIHTQRYRRLKSKYQAFKKRLDRYYKNGNFFRFSLHKQQQLLQRLQRYLQALQRLAAPAALFSASLLCSPTLEAQTFTEVTDTNSPFIFIEGIDTDAPLGLSAVRPGNAGYTVPSLVDIDNDGDLDAFISNGSISYFENTSTDSSIPAFSLISTENPFGLERVGQGAVPIFVDIDSDGDLDVFVGENYGDINFFENTSTDSSVPAFSLSSSTSPFGLSGDFEQSAPSFIDIDNDGDVDAFIGEQDGEIIFFENTSSDISIPAFTFSASNNPFGLLSSLTFNKRRSLVGFSDIDDDGDVDAFVRVNDVDARIRKIIFYENTSINSSIPAFSYFSDTTPFGLNTSSPFSPPNLVDIDNDGDLDAFIGDTYGVTNYLKNIGTKSSPQFQVPFVDVGRHSAPALIDIDSDGDLDLFSGKYSGFVFYENVGNSVAPVFQLSESSTPFGLNSTSKYSTPCFVDIDKDNDADIFFGENGGGFTFHRNTSTDVAIPAYLQEGSNPFGLTRRGFYSAPEFEDIDGDGDIDMFSGVPFLNEPDTYFFENTSTDSSIPVFEEKGGLTPFGLEGIVYLDFVDIDGDGDSDAFNGDFGSISFSENIGSSTNPSFVKSSETAPFGLPDVGDNIHPVIVDLDNDGFYEAIIGEVDGNLNYFESDISTSFPKLEITDINTLKTEFCLNETETFAEVRLGNRGCDRNGNAIYTASVTPAGQGVSASVVGTGASDCSFIIELTALETAVAANYSINLTVEDADGVNNTSSTPEISNTGTVLFFNLGIVEVLNSEQVEVEPIAGMTIDNGTSEDIMVNINNTKSTTTYEWIVAGVSLPILTGDDVDTGAAIPIDLGDGNIINVSASTESVVGDFTQSILSIDNPAGGAAQDFEVSLTATQECGPDTQSAIFTSGDFDCSDADLILGSRILPTDNYEAFSSITSESIIVPSSGVAFRAGTMIELKPNFHAQSGATFTAEIEDCTTETNEALEERHSIITPSISSLQIAPNPTNGTSQLQFQLAKAHPVVVEIYDARGTLTTTVLNEQLEKGIHQIALPTADFSNGMYFVIVRTQDGNMVEKLMVLGE
ncbi:MAG: FG-GAP-like repeat-containing protein [Bacteroidota bacterium]